jgi:hypothetical protein
MEHPKENAYTSYIQNPNENNTKPRAPIKINQN